MVSLVACCFFALLGLILSMIYEMAKRGSSKYSFLIAIVSAFVVLTIFADGFMSSISYWIQASVFQRLLIVTVLVFIVLSRVRLCLMW